MTRKIKAGNQPKAILIVILLMIISLAGTLILAQHHQEQLKNFAKQGQDNIDWAYFSVERTYYPIKQVLADIKRMRAIEGQHRAIHNKQYDDLLADLDLQYSLFASSVDNIKGQSFSFVLDYKSPKVGKEPMLDNIKSNYIYLLSFTKQIDQFLKEDENWDSNALNYMLEHENELEENIKNLSLLANQKLSQYLSDRQDTMMHIEKYVLTMFFFVMVFMLMFSILVFHYISKLSKATSELKDVNENLTIARDEVLEAFQSKSMFIAKMSHEVRTPLNSILGFAQVMENDLENPLNTEQQENLRHILKAGNHLLLLANEILDYSKLEAGKISISKDNIAVSAIIDDVRYMLKNELKMGGNELEVSLEKNNLAIHADLLRIKQVMINIVSNAIKYGYKAKPIQISVSTQQNNEILIAVRNEGDTIDEHTLKQLFNPYFRGNKEITNIEGYGIGLHISKRLIEMMDGKIYCESFNNHTTFYVVLQQGQQNSDSSTNAHNEIRELKYLMMVSNHQRYIDEIRNMVQNTHIEPIIVPDKAYAMDILKYMEVPVVLYTKEIVDDEWIDFVDKNNINGYYLDLEGSQDNTIGLEQVKLIIHDVCK